MKKPRSQNYPYSGRREMYKIATSRIYYKTNFFFLVDFFSYCFHNGVENNSKESIIIVNIASCMDSYCGILVKKKYRT